MDFTSGYTRPKSGISLADSKWATAPNENYPNDWPMDDSAPRSIKSAGQRNSNPGSWYEQQDSRYERTHFMNGTSKTGWTGQASPVPAGTTSYAKPNPKIWLSESKWAPRDEVTSPRSEFERSCNEFERSREYAEPMEGVWQGERSSKNTKPTEQMGSLTPWGNKPAVEEPRSLQSARPFQSSTFMENSRPELRSFPPGRSGFGQKLYENVPHGNEPFKSIWSENQSNNAPWSEAPRGGTWSESKSNNAPWGETSKGGTWGESKSNNTPWGEAPKGSAWSESQSSIAPWCEAPKGGAWGESKNTNDVWSAEDFKNRPMVRKSWW